MNFSNAVGVSYSRRSEMAGDHLKIRNILEINIRSAIVVSNNNFLATHSEIVGKEDSAYSGATFYTGISINGVSFGEGYVSNLIADPEGTDAQVKTYSATITITSEGELDKVIKAINPEISKYIDSISESYSNQQSFHRRITSHSCSIKLNAPSNLSSTGDQIVAGMLKDRSKLDSIFGLADRDVFIFKNYSYDEESQSYNYEDVKEWVENELSDDSTIVIQQGSFSYSNGVIIASFSADITGIQGDSLQSRSDAALAKASGLLNQRAEELFGSYSGLVQGNKDSLKNNTIVNQSITHNRNEARCSVTVTYSNSFDIQTSNSVYWEYGIEVQELAGEKIVGEQGRVIGGGVITSISELDGSPEKFDNASSFFNGQCSLSAAKGRTGGVIAISSSVSRNYGEGTITYKYNFSDNPSLIYGDNDGGATKERKKIISENEQMPLNLFSTFLIPENKEILQKQQNILPNLKLKRVNITTNATSNISDFKNNLTRIENDKIGDSVSIRFSPKKRECTCESRYFEILQ